MDMLTIAMRSPGNTLVDVTAFGAVGDGVTDSTDAIQVAAASRGPGGTVHIPSGVTILTRPFTLPNGVSLVVDGVLRGAVGNSALREWPTVPPLPTYGRDRDGAKPRRYLALISANGSHHFSIRGRGAIDGQGAWWWGMRGKLKYGRPHLIELYACAHVEVASLTLLNSAFWTLHPVYSEHVTIRRVTIRAPLYAPNTDGIDPDSSRHVLIEHCDISVGDDHVAIKSGMNDVARHGFPRFETANITVRHNVMRAGMGISVGSETAGGIRDVRVHENLILGDGWSVGLHLKSAAQRGGVVSRVSFRNNDVRNTTALMRMAVFGRSTPPTTYAATAIRDVEWVGNRYRSALDRKVRSKFLCPGTNLP